MNGIIIKLVMTIPKPNKKIVKPADGNKLLVGTH